MSRISARLRLEKADPDAFGRIRRCQHEKEDKQIVCHCAVVPMLTSQYVSGVVMRVSQIEEKV